MPATDDYAGYAKGIESPALHAAAITPNDSADLTNVTRAIFIGGAGTMKVTTLGGETVTYTGLLAGTTKAIRVTRVWSTGTTATNLMAEW